MSSAVLFAGTTEGRLVAAACAGQPLELHVCVATEYGETLIAPADNIVVHAGRMDAGQMAALFRQTGAELALDATHPYAAAVTETIKAACRETGTEYLRLLRAQEHGGTENCVFVASTAEAAGLLNEAEGSALLTVGSKELAGYTCVKDFQKRLFARILPMPAAVEQAMALGFEGKNLICMQGPFSRELNAALLRDINAEYLVTKDTGAPGGFPEKLAAAADAGARVIVIRRPASETGASLSECLTELERRFGVRRAKKVAVAGAGPGAPGLLTGEAAEAFARAELIIGARRVTDSLSRFGKPVINAVLPEDIAKAVTLSPATDIAVAMSGDTGFYSGTKKLLPLLEGCETRVLPGISSPVLFAARLGIGWDQARLVSTHGRSCNFPAAVRTNRRVIALTGGRGGDAASLIRLLNEYGLGSVRVTVGADLSYPQESFASGTAAELAGREFPPLAVLMAENPEAEKTTVTGGLADEAFQRDRTPMTKSEVRAVTLSKLRLTAGSVCWDVGAGTGSVSVEMALLCPEGRVWAIEREPGACGLIGRNARRLGAANLTVVQGTAPEALETLEPPTHVFIGGSGGGMSAIVRAALKKNPMARIVINTVTAESLSEAVSLMGRDGELVQVQVSAGRQAGPYHLMTAQNPVFIISFGGGKADE